MTEGLKLIMEFSCAEILRAGLYGRIYPGFATVSPNGSTDDVSENSLGPPAIESTVNVMEGLPARECTSDEQVAKYVPWDIR
ncbi:hypothetical protein TSTA_058450 [Talaromyces stipitatus ATCC 10500]|uniref:Uncharacterized protein n=1 Tax=Talaromyces stipitatus (strain ATCC 10500 / CBS 375.48 / QM 6759 / NRRL 1006) TaxID=441959 RepID=B8MQF5_TALSN|nr:uncharacterized protein TSTA_058450 [Talaromyces stipitatus ATCC 10500]EED13357.1 hypothetical protein TSTA_058450 [Talaromyces stipitatus ATCC 10500]